MTKKSLIEIRNELEQKELHAKIAQVEQYWGDDQEALNILADAVAELEKQAAEGAFGDEGLSPSQLLTMGVAMTNDLLEDLRKEASEETSEAAEEVSEEVAEGDDAELSDELIAKMAEAYETAFTLGSALGQIGLDSDEIAKVANASEEEAEELARFLVELNQVLTEDSEEA